MPRKTLELPDGGQKLFLEARYTKGDLHLDGNAWVSVVLEDAQITSISPDWQTKLPVIEDRPVNEPLPLPDLHAVRVWLEDQRDTLPKSERRSLAGVRAALEALDDPDLTSRVRLGRLSEDPVPVAYLRLGGVIVTWPPTGGPPSMIMVG